MGSVERHGADVERHVEERYFCKSEKKYTPYPYTPRRRFVTITLWAIIFFGGVLFFLYILRVYVFSFCYFFSLCVLEFASSFIEMEGEGGE